MRTLEHNQYTPVFTPRFHLSDGSMVGIEVKIKCRQKILSAKDAFKLIQSGKSGDLLKQINLHLSKWSEKAENNLYLSWEISCETTQLDLAVFLDALSSSLPLNQLEIMLDARDLTTDQGLEKCQQLFTHFPAKGVRRGLFHSRPCDFVMDGLCKTIDIFKINKSMITDMKNDVPTAHKGYWFIDRLNKENIDMVVDDLYCKEDVTSVILMGIKYGQGYFLSRNQSPQKAVKRLEKKPGADFYERRFDCFDSLLWY